MTEGFILKIHPNSDSPLDTREPKGAEAETQSDSGSTGDQDDTQTKTEPTSVYLVEPLRKNSSVTKYSGTLGALHSHDQRTSTMAAFSHYVAEDTACRYIFADIQG